MTINLTPEKLAQFEAERKAKLAAMQKQEAELQAIKIRAKTYWQNKHATCATTKPVHLLAKDGHYCCNLDAKVKPEQSTSDPAESTCKLCNNVFAAYWTAPFYHMAYSESRGENAVPFFKEMESK